jgi:5-(aminomethyl)-3-furanmethanol phosphate kinase
MIRAMAPATIVKVGGALLNAPDAFVWALDQLSRAPRDGTVLVVPGGGPFADAIRAVDRRIGLTDTAAHWAAILGMNQYALVLADLLPGATVVETVYPPNDCLPVLAPYTWLRCHDTLPHSWDVTSDSIAAHIANSVGAKRLILMKLATVTDPYFHQAAEATEPGARLAHEFVLPVTEIQW